jgi:hypothetical protein
VLLDS